MALVPPPVPPSPPMAEFEKKNPNTVAVVASV